MTTIETRSTRDSAAMLVEEAPERKRPRRSAESTPCSEGGPAASRRFAERELRTPYGYLDFSATVGSPERDGLSGLVPLNLNLGFEHVADEHRAVASPEARRERRFCLDGSAVVEDALVKVFDRLDMVELQLANSTCTHWRRLIDSNKELRPKLPTRVPMARNFIELYRIDKMLELAQSKSPALDVSNDKARQRRILVDWLVDVQTHFKMSTETLHMAVALVDRVWALNPAVLPRRIQAMGAACLFVSAKFVETYAPGLNDMVWVCDWTYTKDELVEMELHVLKLLAFQVRAATPVSFISATLQALGSATGLAHEAAVEMACYHADLFLVQADSAGVSAAQVGAAAVVSSFFTLRSGIIPLKPVCFLCRVPEDATRRLVCRLQELHASDHASGSTGRTPDQAARMLHAVYERYSGSVVGTQPARTPPRTPIVTRCECQQRRGACWWCRREECGSKLPAGAVEVVAIACSH